MYKNYRVILRDSQTYNSEGKYKEYVRSLPTQPNPTEQESNGNMVYAFTYFDGRGRGELIRYIFAAKNIKFEDNRVDQKDWQALKPNTPAGYLPILKCDGIVLSESMAIARFAANEAGIAGTTNIEKATADMIASMARDCFEKIIKAFFIKDDKEKADTMKELTEKDLPSVLSNIEKIISQSSKCSGYSVGKGLTWADLALYDLWGLLQGLGDAAKPICKAVPKISAICDKVPTIPGIADWLKKRPSTKF